MIGRAGPAEKTGYLRDVLGPATAFDYHDGPVTDSLRAAAPDGVDLCFDNVGGDRLEAAIELLRPGGRAVICGAVSRYGDGAGTAGPRSFLRVVHQDLTLRGFTVTSHEELRPGFERAASGWLREGELRPAAKVVEGFGRVPEAFASLFGAPR